MAHETEPHRETPTSRFIAQTEQSFDELLGHAIWNVGMPYEPPNDTPLRWALTQYAHEDSPRDIGLWIKLDEQRFVYLTKILRQASPGDGLWKVVVTERPDDDTEIVTAATILESGKVDKNQTIKKKAEDENVEIEYTFSQWDYTKHQRSKILPYLTSTLEEATRVMPQRQEEFMQNMDHNQLHLAYVMQMLGTLSVNAPEASANK